MDDVLKCELLHISLLGDYEIASKLVKILENPQKRDTFESTLFEGQPKRDKILKCQKCEAHR